MSMNQWVDNQEVKNPRARSQVRGSGKRGDGVQKSTGRDPVTATKGELDLFNESQRTGWRNTWLPGSATSAAPNLHARGTVALRENGARHRQSRGRPRDEGHSHFASLLGGQHLALHSRHHHAPDQIDDLTLSLHHKEHASYVAYAQEDSERGHGSGTGGPSVDV